MKRIMLASFIVALSVTTYFAGVVSHDRIEVLTRPVYCAIVEHYHPGARCDAVRRPPKIKRNLPGWNNNG